MNRRDIIKAASLLTLSSAAGNAAAPSQPAKASPVRKIATEEACTFPEVAAEYRKLVQRGGANLDLEIVHAIYGTSASPANETLSRLLDIGAGRIATMDSNGVDMHLLSLSSPGVQMFDNDTGVALAELANDRIAAAIAKYPARLCGLAAVAPQDPVRSANEMERAIKKLNLNGFIINSHTDNRYLDESFFWPILEAAEALDRPIYIHPRSPSDGMAGPFRGVSLPSWGYNMETSTHAVRLIFTGIFDRFPKLKIVLGHMGEAVHFWQARLDNRYQLSSYARGYVKLDLLPSEYLRRNFAITTSGTESHPALEYSIKTLGADHIMWAIDYPFERSDLAVSFMDSAPIDDADKKLIYGGNAARIFRIDS